MIESNVLALPTRPCSFCHKKEATQLCDFVVDYVWTSMKDKHGHIIGPLHITCDNEICKDCAMRIGGHEFCPSCHKLYLYVEQNHDRRKRRGSIDD